MYKLINFLPRLLLLVGLMASQSLSAAEASFQPTSTGWLIDDNHPVVAVDLQLTGENNLQLKTVNALLEIQLEGDWKTYWRSPGDGGIAPKFDFSGSENIKNVTWSWPAPKRHNVLGIDTLGYKGNVNFPLTLEIVDPTQPVLLKGTLTLATCTNICVLSHYQIELPFAVDALRIDPRISLSYREALANVPIKLDKHTVQAPIHVASTHWNNQHQTLTIELDKKSPWYHPDIFVDSSAFDLTGYSFSAPVTRIENHKLIAQIKVTSWDGDINLNGKSLQLTVIDKDLSVELPAIAGGGSSTGTLWSMFLIALIGGLILNVMPCVLPVLGMKLSSVLGAGGIERQVIRKQFIASSMGILSSFWLLAGFLLTLKLSGEALGWGIQFQNGYFIAAMVIITALFAANMLDIFTIQLPSKVQTWLATSGKNSYIGHYLQGMFATLLATPCSAPFLGTAVAFSLAASTPQLFIIFTALGLGMALPWILIAIFPSIALCLPKPGNWMNHLKTFFALLILITCYWLLSLLVNFIGLPITLTLGLLLSGLLLFLIIKKRNKALCLVVFVTILSISSGMAAFQYLTRSDADKASALNWKPLDRTVIDQQVKLGKVVFVDVTADWCVTCKANKIGVLLQDPVYSRLQQSDIVPMKGDWTLADDSVTQYLQSYGRYGVPFNIVYGPSAPEGLPLSTILTSDSVLSAIKKAK